MRGRLLNIPAIGRAAGFALVAAAIVATTAALSIVITPSRSRPPLELQPSVDPLAAELARCQSIGIAREGRRRLAKRPGPRTAAASSPTARADSGARTAPQQLALPSPEDR